MPNTNFVSLLILFAGFIIGLGAVTVIDLLGFLGRKSSYWTEATTRTHKVTKPLIWIGIVLAIIGGTLFYSTYEFNNIFIVHIISAIIMSLNGIFLSFSVSPFLINREKNGQGNVLLPKIWQIKITIAFIISFTAWWSNFILIIYFISNRL